ncbi:MAG: prepilin-type N-terminal cleavage/methylation domain-containing protein [Alphaproteobacteria bacterium]|nr:prepilin-type N-terminal cleavage/methylation domain-containing protein [Alphaproteobacteria bacterium]
MLVAHSGPGAPSPAIQEGHAVAASTCSKHSASGCAHQEASSSSCPRQPSPRKPRPRSDRNSGFTLIEALVALTILALSLTTLFQSYSSGLHLVRTMDDHLKARTLARSLLNEGAYLAPTTDLDRKGTVGVLDWSLKVTPAPARLSPDEQENRWRLYQVTAVVDIPGRRSIRFDTLVMGSRR